MKIIHLSDLHIGKRIDNYSLIEDQKFILNEITKIIDEEKPQAVIIAGDIYDKVNPSDEAVNLLDDFLVKLSKFDTEVFVLSGNHDSAEKIAFASKLIDASGIHMSPVYRGEIAKYTLSDEYGPVNIFMLPHIRPLHVRRYLGETIDEEIKTYSDAMRVALSKADINPKERNILVSHQTISGCIRCDSEESIGGSDGVDAQCYKDFDYVALGHIHSPQDIKNCTNIMRYSGTPLKYSISEISHNKSVTIVELSEKKSDKCEEFIKLTERELKPLNDFVRINDTFENIVEKYKGKANTDYVDIVLKDETEVPDAYRKLQNIFCHVVHMDYEYRRKRNKKQDGNATVTTTIKEIDMVDMLFDKILNYPMSEVQRNYVETVIDELKNENLSKIVESDDEE